MSTPINTLKKTITTANITILPSNMKNILEKIATVMRIQAIVTTMWVREMITIYNTKSQLSKKWISGSINLLALGKELVQEEW